MAQPSSLASSSPLPVQSKGAQPLIPALPLECITTKDFRTSHGIFCQCRPNKTSQSQCQQIPNELRTAYIFLPTAHSY
eukprot:scaffold126406_cov18-Tisochrysis_lutea.AAC.1